MPILVVFIGYKGFSIGYTISTLIKLIGTLEGNKYAFQNLFIPNALIVFIMIFLTNYSIKISTNFFSDRVNIKANALKYTFITISLTLIYVLICMIGKVFF